jgi:uncharacterized protein DUF5655
VPTSPPWTCPNCGRAFRRAHQPHACGLGDRASLLRGKPPALVKVYQALERDLAKWGPHETFTRERYALYRIGRGFADLVFMRDGLRLAVYLGRTRRAACFFKVGRMSTHRIIHVAMLRTLTDWRTVRPYLKEAYRFAKEEDASRQTHLRQSIRMR